MFFFKENPCGTPAITPISFIVLVHFFIFSFIHPIIVYSLTFCGHDSVLMFILLFWLRVLSISMVSILSLAGFSFLFPDARVLSILLFPGRSVLITCFFPLSVSCKKWLICFSTSVCGSPSVCEVLHYAPSLSCRLVLSDWLWVLL